MALVARLGLALAPLVGVDLLFGLAFAFDVLADLLLELLAFLTEGAREVAFEFNRYTVALAFGFATVFAPVLVVFIFGLSLDLALFAATFLTVFFVVVLLACVVARPLPETEVRALETAFLTPALIDFGVRSLRFLFRRDVDSSSTLSSLRLVPASVDLPPLRALVLDFFLSSTLGSLGRWSLGRGPNTPRQVDAPQRHSWTFFWEKGL